MSTFLWLAIALVSLGSVAAIVTAIVGTIDDDDRRFSVEMIISFIIIVTLVGCGTLGLIHKAQTRDDAAEVQTETIFES